MSGSPRLVVTVLAALLVLGGCASFPDAGSAPWRERPEVDVERPPRPEPPAPEAAPPPAAPGGDAGSEPCVDPDPAVVATCLAPISAVATLPGGTSALVAERTTGRLVQVGIDEDPVEIARVEVDAAGDGGLTGVALSPTYAEDQLVYLYATTPQGNAVLRVATGDTPKPVLTGIPSGPDGNAGAIGVEPDGTLLVATGDAGDPAAASSPASLAGKLLRIDPFGAPAEGVPDPTTPVIGSGLRSPGDVCADVATGTTWVTDRAGGRDVLLAVRPGQAATGAAAAPAWTWPERPGVAGCAASPGQLLVGLTGASSMYALRPTPEGAFVGEPQEVLADVYGRISGADVASDGMIWIGTANRGAGGPETPTDDRVIRLRPPTGGAAGAE